jgi:hypothetical protein
MRRFLLSLAVVLLLAPGVWAANITAGYSWEDGTNTIITSYGNLVGDTNVTGPQTGSQGSTLPDYTCPGANTTGPHSGPRYLHVAEDPHSGTPEAYIIWVRGLTDGDVVDASFYGYDITPGTGPSLRIWAKYTSTNDPDDYDGSASGNYDYTAGTGWDQLSHSWTFDSSGGTRDGLMISARLYSTPSTSSPDHTDYWIDDALCTFPDHATIRFAPEPTSLALLALGGLVAVRRRR